MQPRFWRSEGVGFSAQLDASRFAHVGPGQPRWAEVRAEVRPGRTPVLDGTGHRLVAIQRPLFYAFVERMTT